MQHDAQRTWRVVQGRRCNGVAVRVSQKSQRHQHVIAAATRAAAGAASWWAVAFVGSRLPPSPLRASCVAVNNNKQTKRETVSERLWKAHKKPTEHSEVDRVKSTNVVLSFLCKTYRYRYRYAAIYSRVEIIRGRGITRVLGVPYRYGIFEVSVFHRKLSTVGLHRLCRQEKGPVGRAHGCTDWKDAKNQKQRISFNQ